jgi:DNA-directed RNA polymerase specialized sigma24 family protein
MQQKQQDEDELDQNADSLSLYDRYGQAIFAYARLHVPSREDAEDVTLEVFHVGVGKRQFFRTTGRWVRN